ncbi:MAG TPA: YbaK/EbsC family protein [Candidatus Eremiobacteraceae bacterium]|nr:YbaK/EbsC family protein [Candidatus Eremiobacteraceae bacterium]
MPLNKLREFLDTYNIRYLIFSHSLAYTAQGIAALTHISGKELAKTVIVKIDGDLAMAVVPASRHVDLRLLKQATGARTVELASEQEFKDKFPDCEAGAMPPFGNLYGMAVYADESLTSIKEITFNAGTHRDLLRMDWADLVRLVEPKIVQITKSRVAETAA